MKIAIVWRGDPQTLPLAFPPRLQPIADALLQLDVTPSPVAFGESAVDDARGELLSCDGALAWVDPLTDGVDRTRFDALLREISSQGVWASAHPDVILKMGVKEVLVRTSHFGWGSGAYAYNTVETFRAAFPARLAADRVRVLKQNRGNSNQGVWKVEIEGSGAGIGPQTRVKVLEARNDIPESGVLLSEFMARCECYLIGDGCIIDQAFQSRVDEGLVRCYMCQGSVIGFSEQFPRNRALGESSLPSFGMAREKTMHPETSVQFQDLRRQMETEWTPGLQSLLRIETDDLPVLWDADFLYGPKTSHGEDSFVLCEINASCVTPYPLAAAARIARAAKDRTAVFRRRRPRIS